MDILVFSDSHGKERGMREALARQVRRVHAVFFLGDGLRDVNRLELGETALFAVSGNCDWGSAAEAPDEIVIALEGHTLMAVHGHRYRVKDGYGALLARAAEIGADIVLSGHTHLPHAETLPAGTVLGRVTLERPMYLLNPGSIAAGSFGTLTLQRGSVLMAHGAL